MCQRMSFSSPCYMMEIKSCGDQGYHITLGSSRLMCCERLHSETIEGGSSQHFWRPFPILCPRAFAWGQRLFPDSPWPTHPLPKHQVTAHPQPSTNCKPWSCSGSWISSYHLPAAETSLFFTWSSSLDIFQQWSLVSEWLWLYSMNL